MLYACYDLLKLDFIMEVSWRHGLNDFTMVGPFILRSFPFLFSLFSSFLLLSSTLITPEKHS